MKKVIILLSLVLFTASPLFAVDEAAMRVACPIKYIETWKDKENREKCEANFRYTESQTYKEQQRQNNQNNMQSEISRQNDEIQQLRNEQQVRDSQQQIRDSQQRLNDIYNPRR